MLRYKAICLRIDDLIIVFQCSCMQVRFSVFKDFNDDIITTVSYKRVFSVEPLFVDFISLTYSCYLSPSTVLNTLTI